MTPTCYLLPDPKQPGQYSVFYKGPLTEEQDDFDRNASIGLTWSTDLRTWQWPGE